MPIKDPEKNKAFQRTWVAKQRAAETPIEKALRLERRRFLRSQPQQIRAAAIYEKRNVQKSAERKQRSKFKKEYGVFWEAAQAALKLSQVLGRAR